MDINSMGIGYMLKLLGGDKKTARSHNAAVGKVIKSVTLDPEQGDGGALIMQFTDGTGIKAWDDARSCCENRYMTTDDDLVAFVGATFTGMELRDAPDVEESYAVHEVQFLLVNTSLGTFTLETHNEHNGYYGGIMIVIRPL